MSRQISNFVFSSVLRRYNFQADRAGQGIHIQAGKTTAGSTFPLAVGGVFGTLLAVSLLALGAWRIGTIILLGMGGVMLRLIKIGQRKAPLSKSFTIAPGQIIVQNPNGDTTIFTDLASEDVSIGLEMDPDIPIGTVYVNIGAAAPYRLFDLLATEDQFIGDDLEVVRLYLSRMLDGGAPD